MNTETIETVGTPDSIPFGDTQMGKDIGTGICAFLIFSGLALWFWAMSR